MNDITASLEVMTPCEVADILRSQPTVIIRLLRSGKMGGIKVGGKWRITRQSLNEYLGITAEESNENYAE